MKPILSLFTALFFAASCTKDDLQKPERCDYGCLVSYKYRADSTYIKTDTLWNDKICGRWIDTIRAQINKGDYWIDFRGCPLPIPSLPEFRIEKRTYYIY